MRACIYIYIYIYLYLSLSIYIYIYIYTHDSRRSADWPELIAAKAQPALANKADNGNTTDNSICIYFDMYMYVYIYIYIYKQMNR